MTPVERHFGTRAPRYAADAMRAPWASVRRREARAVLEALAPLDGCAVLDLGCGAGFYACAALAAGAASVHGVDLAPAMVTAAGRCDPRTTVQVGDASTVQLGRRFERVVIAGVLEFVPEPRRVLENARAHAAPGARLALLVPSGGIAEALYARYHARHGIRVNRGLAREIPAVAEATGWLVRRRREVAPLATVVELVAG